MYRTDDFPPPTRGRRAAGPNGASSRPVPLDWLPLRERQIAEIVAAGQAVTAVQIGEALNAPISNAAVRSMLGRLEKKGVVRRQKQGRKFVYMPATSSEEAALAALSEIVARHFDGSTMDAALALLGMLPARDAAQYEAVSRLSKLLRQVELD